MAPGEAGCWQINLTPDVCVMAFDGGVFIAAKAAPTKAGDGAV